MSPHFIRGIKFTWKIGLKSNAIKICFQIDLLAVEESAQIDIISFAERRGFIHQNNFEQWTTSFLSFSLSHTHTHTHTHLICLPLQFAEPCGNGPFTFHIFLYSFYVCSFLFLPCPWFRFRISLCIRSLLLSFSYFILFLCLISFSFTSLYFQNCNIYFSSFFLLSLVFSSSFSFLFLLCLFLLCLLFVHSNLDIRHLLL